MSSNQPSQDQAPVAATPAPPAAPLSPIRAAIVARMAAKKKAAAKPPPPAGRKAQELDSEATPRIARQPSGTIRRG